MADIIPIADHLPEVNAELVESLRVMLSEAQAGRLTGLAAVYITDEGDARTTFRAFRNPAITGARHANDPLQWWTRR